MKTITISNEDAIKIHFRPNTKVGDVTYFSGFMAAIRDARKATSRNEDNGEKIPEKHYGSWLGAIGYMTTLNQIGNCFRPKNSALIKGNTIIKALSYFSSLSKAEREAIYALRCSFTHDYSLSNINPGNPLRQHRFTVCQGSDFIVKLPKDKWNGDYNNRTRDNCTIISLEGFGDLVEGIIKKLIVLANNDELGCILNGGCNELLLRYSFYAKQ